MKLAINIFLYFAIALLVVQNLLPAAALCALLFTFRAGGIWLIPLGFFIDGYFGAFYSVPVCSLVAIVWYVASEYLRPLLIIQYKTYA